MASVQVDNAALEQEIRQLEQENARLIQATLQQTRAALMEENARLQNVMLPAIGAPPGFETQDVLAPSVLSTSAPPGIQPIAPGLQPPAPGLQPQWDPTLAADAAMLAFVQGKQGAFLSGMQTPSGTSSMQSSIASSFASSYSNFSSMGLGGEGFEMDPSQQKTTLILRNVPNSYTRDMIIDLLDTHGYNAEYDLIYIPIDFNTRAGFGYAFVNFVNGDSAEDFIKEFQGFRNWVIRSEKVLDVTWSSAHQGLNCHVERYRNSPVMHESVTDELKPAIFVNGKRVPFPRPTKKIRAPKRRSP